MSEALAQGRRALVGALTAALLPLGATFAARLKTVPRTPVCATLAAVEHVEADRARERASHPCDH